MSTTVPLLWHGSSKRTMTATIQFSRHSPAMLTPPPPTQLHPAARLPLTLIAMFLFVWGGCGGSEWTEKLPGGYAIADWDPPDRLLVGPENKPMIGDWTGPGVARRGISGTLVYGVLDDHSQFLLDTSTGKIELFAESEAWNRALSAAGITWPRLREPGPRVLGSPFAWLSLVITVPAFIVFALLSLEARQRRASIRMLLSGMPDRVVIEGDHRRARRCAKCSYDLAGVVGIPCPECGRQAPWIPTDRLLPMDSPPSIPMWPILLGILPNAALVVFIVQTPSGWNIPGIWVMDLIFFGILTAPGAAVWMFLLSASTRTSAAARRSGGIAALLFLAWLWPLAYVIPALLY